MEEGYPFSGAGNLCEFVQGLISITVQNNVIVVFDNDAEGVVSFNQDDGVEGASLTRSLRLFRMKEGACSLRRRAVTFDAGRSRCVRSGWGASD